jgi:hypothetical protein
METFQLIDITDEDILQIHKEKEPGYALGNNT